MRKILYLSIAALLSVAFSISMAHFMPADARPLVAIVSFFIGIILGCAAVLIAEMQEEL